MSSDRSVYKYDDAVTHVQVMADLENGLWAGSQKNAPATSINFTWVTAMAKGKHS
eukprot:COSAG02_NODE_27230_length_614_cov_0.966990_1_plen_54_part_01